MRYLFPLNPKNQQRQYQKMTWVYPVHLAMYATYLKNQGHEVICGEVTVQRIVDSVFCDILGYPKLPVLDEDFDKIIDDESKIDIPFDQLPIPDRVFTDAKNPRWQKYGNYKHHPATHMLSALGCTHGKCSFCYEKDKPLIVRPVDHVMEEIAGLVNQGYNEVFDDAATLPDGAWRVDLLSRILRSFKRISIGCNLRLCDGDFCRMGNAGFRMVLVGIESANQETLDKINKGTKASDIIPVLKKMSEAGLEPHITVMFGYPWETEEDSIRTVKLVHYLLKKGYAKTAQASVFSPPRTIPDSNSVGHKYVKQVYDVYKSPEFLWRKLTSIREWADIKYLLRSGRLVFTEKYKPTGKK